ncbi:MAG TPA: hypothetical protein VKZ94_08005 [Advenella sp.]|nr:hypothetical protein [Advenella sp.]
MKYALSLTNPAHFLLARNSGGLPESRFADPDMAGPPASDA